VASAPEEQLAHIHTALLKALPKNLAEISKEELALEILAHTRTNFPRTFAETFY
jgi:hypothetical protein